MPTLVVETGPLTGHGLYQLTDEFQGCLSLWLQDPELGLQMHVTTLSFYMRAGYTLSGPHACAVRTVPTKTSPPPYSED